MLGDGRSEGAFKTLSSVEGPGRHGPFLCSVSLTAAGYWVWGDPMWPAHFPKVAQLKATWRVRCVPLQSEV